MQLGIDFGTTRTVVANANAGRYPVASFDRDGAWVGHVPGLVAWENGALRYGWDAWHAVLDEDAPAIRSLKRVVQDLGPDDEIPALGPGFTVLEVLTGYLAALREQIETASTLEVPAGEPLEVTISVPANASSQQRYVTMEAFARAGFQVCALLNEPTAAAIEFAHRNAKVLGPRSPKRYVAVYDLGGGTFDTSAVSLVGRRFELLATEGIGHAGGDDFDQVILGEALAAAGAEKSELAPHAIDGLLEICREAKETLRPNTRKLLVDLGQVVDGLDPVVLDPKAIYARCQPLIEPTLELVDRVLDRLEEHGIDRNEPRELGGLYVVGGASALPPVARALRDRYGRKVQFAAEPHASTAIGLAIAGDPDAAVLVREATTRHVGVWREREDGRCKVFDVILSKGVLPREGEPIVVERTYHPRHAIGELRFLECAALGEDMRPDGDVTPLGRLAFPYDPALADRDDLNDLDVTVDPSIMAEEIRETYTYGADGTVEVDIENRTHGYGRHFVLGRA